MSEAWNLFSQKLNNNIDFESLKNYATEKYNHQRHVEMRKPCSIEELMAIILVL